MCSFASILRGSYSHFRHGELMLTIRLGANHVTEGLALWAI
jgi:hypothetical protein